MVYNLGTLVILARVLSGPIFTAVIAVTAITLYLQPFNQASARGNYVALRAHGLAPTGTPAPPEVTALLYASLILTLGLCISLSLLVIRSFPGDDVALWLYLLAGVLNNIWYYDLQFVLWAQDITIPFERLSFFRRLFLFACFIPLLVTKNFLLFAFLMDTVSVVFLLLLIRIAPQPRLLLPANLRHLTWADTRIQLWRFGAALLSTLSELIVFNAPYAVIFFAYRLGPALIAVDSVLKLTRICLTVTRNISEVALPKQSQARRAGDHRQSLRLFGGALLAALAPNSVLALCLAVKGGLVFHLMLGPNNVLPEGAGAPVGVIQIAATVYGAASFFLALTGHDREIVRLTIAATIGMALYAAIVVVTLPTIILMLWCYAAFLAVVAAASGVMIASVFGRRAVPV